MIVEMAGGCKAQQRQAIIGQGPLRVESGQYPILAQMGRYLLGRFLRRADLPIAGVKRCLPSIRQFDRLSPIALPVSSCQGTRITNGNKGASEVRRIAFGWKTEIVCLLPSFSVQGRRTRNIPVARHGNKCKCKTTGIAYCLETQIVCFVPPAGRSIAPNSLMRLHGNSPS